LATLTATRSPRADPNWVSEHIVPVNAGARMGNRVARKIVDTLLLTR
jgi:hypothetical protein